MSLIKFLKCLIGLGSVKDKSICEFSEKYFDIHDYTEDKGGDGKPTHFYKYCCSSCGKEFYI